MIVNTHHYSVPVTFHDITDPEWNPPGDNNETLGYFDLVAMTIKVRVDAHPAMKADTVLHEVLHFAAMCGGIDNETKYTEEQFISGITAGLKQIIVHENDGLFEYLGMSL